MQPARAHRADSFRGVVFGRGAGWAVAAVLAGAVVALSILLAEGTGGPRTNFVVGPPVAQRITPIAPGAQVFPGPRTVVPRAQAVPGGLSIGGQALSPLPRLLIPMCLKAVQGNSATPSPSASASAAARPPAVSLGPGQIQIRLPNGKSATCKITVQPAK